MRQQSRRRSLCRIDVEQHRTDDRTCQSLRRQQQLHLEAVELLGLHMRHPEHHYQVEYCPPLYAQPQSLLGPSCQAVAQTPPLAQDPNPKRRDIFGCCQEDALANQPS